MINNHALPGLIPNDLELLHHFNSHTLGTLGSLSVQKVISSCLPTALQFDFLKHAILALAASHLMYLSEREDLSMNRHLDRALLTFRQRLSSPVLMSQVDAILTSCVLLNTIAFSRGRSSSSDSWLFTETAEIQWLTAQMGLKSIMSNMRHMLKGTSWSTVYIKEASHPSFGARPSFDDDNLVFEDIPGDFRTLFGIDRDSDSNCNIYYSALQSLLPLLSLDPLDISLTALMAVVHRFRPGFYELIQSRDLRALLLLAYWLGLMCQVPLWWVSGRAESECIACCKYLDTRGDDRIRGLLAFPTECCNYNSMGKREDIV
ncbi:MAG: hypothetical protein M1812_001989 [Candelaria pacifica]|nr:MAG: hypothetical protein M1812_001989 [Candelaria pacifica]